MASTRHPERSRVRTPLLGLAGVFYIAALVLAFLGVISFGGFTEFSVGGYDLALNGVLVAAQLGLAFAVGAIIGRWWTPVLLVVPFLVGAVSLVRSGQSSGQGATEGLESVIAGLVAIYVVVSVVLMLGGVGVHKLLARRAASRTS